MAEHQNDFWKQWTQLVAKAWADEGFKRRLVADPVAVFEEHGITVPAGVQLRMIEETAGQMSLVLPAKPSGEELSEDDLNSIAAGYCRPCRSSR